MDISEYKNKVWELFESGKATEGQWIEMTWAVLNASEAGNCPAIDAEIDPEEKQ
jgi:hypothetical protein